MQHLCQGGGALYQQVHEPELFHIDATGGGHVGQGWKTPFKYPGEESTAYPSIFGFCDYVIIRG